MSPASRRHTTGSSVQWAPTTNPRPETSCRVAPPTARRMSGIERPRRSPMTSILAPMGPSASARPEPRAVRHSIAAPSRIAGRVLGRKASARRATLWYPTVPLEGKCRRTDTVDVSRMRFAFVSRSRGCRLVGIARRAEHRCAIRWPSPAILKDRAVPVPAPPCMASANGSRSGRRRFQAGRRPGAARHDPRALSAIAKPLWGWAAPAPSGLRRANKSAKGRRGAARARLTVTFEPHVYLMKRNPAPPSPTRCVGAVARGLLSAKTISNRILGARRPTWRRPPTEGMDRLPPVDGREARMPLR